MSFYEKNMKALEERKPYLYKKMKQTLNLTVEEEESIFRTAQARNGMPILMVETDGKNQRLNSSYDPGHEAQRWVRKFDMRNLAIVISMFGLGNGIIVRELMKSLKQGDKLLIYEPSPQLFRFVMEEYDLGDILSSGSVSLTVKGINDQEIRNLLSSHVDIVNQRSQIICAHPCYDQVYEEHFRDFCKIIEDHINKITVNRNTELAIGRLQISNMLQNLSLLKGSNLAVDLMGYFGEEVPAIIVAAGPSLDKNIEELKQAKGKAAIFAVDTAVKYLLAHDILPDFIVTLDPKKSLHHLADERCRRIPFVTRIDARPENVQKNEKRVIFYNLEGYAKEVYRRLGIPVGILHSGGSVATGAFSVCETMGFRRIILVGQDLAYLGTSTHAGGLQVDVSGAGRNREMVEDIYGNQIYTRYDWYVYLRWFEDAVELFEGEEVIDATEGGAKIHGTTIMTLKEAIKTYCTGRFDCEQMLEELVPTLDQAKLQQVKSMMEQDLADLQDMEQKAQEAISLSERLIDKYHKSEGETRSSTLKSRRISEINQEIGAKAIYQLVDWDLTEDTTEQMENIYQYTEDEKENKIKTYDHAITIYRAIRKTISRLRPLLAEALEKIEE
jgi:hypothetical protein